MSVVRPLGGGIKGAVTVIVGIFVVGLLASCLITIGIWPGQVKLLAPVFCTDAQPDPFVVADTYNPRPGETVTDFSLYCMGPRGDSTDHGFMKPFLLISVVNGLAIFGLLALLDLLAPTRRARRLQSPNGDEGDDDEDAHEAVRSMAPPGSTTGPFVD